MEAIAHSPSFAKKVGVPQSVGQDFSKADKGKNFKRGGDMATKGVNPFAKFEKSGKDVEKKGMKEGSKADIMMDKKQMMGMKKGGMAGGGMPMKDGKPAFIGDGKGAMKHGGGVKKMNMGGMAKGGSASSRADGIAQKGKTKGKMLNKGGMAC
jgi:hypothetical protein